MTVKTGLERRRRLSWGEVPTHSASWLSTESFRHPAVGGRPALVAVGETHLAQDISLSPHVVCSDTRVSVPCKSVEMLFDLLCQFLGLTMECVFTDLRKSFWGDTVVLEVFSADRGVCSNPQRMTHT